MGHLKEKKSCVLPLLEELWWQVEVNEWVQFLIHHLLQGDALLIESKLSRLQPTELQPLVSQRLRQQ
jgi:hypothetical protein